jgi:hypothetical protein
MKNPKMKIHGLSLKGEYTSRLDLVKMVIHFHSP